MTNTFKKYDRPAAVWCNPVRKEDIDLVRLYQEHRCWLRMERFYQAHGDIAEAQRSKANAQKLKDQYDRKIGLNQNQ